MKSLLEIKNLSITFEFNDQIVNAVRDSSFKINRGECLAIVVKVVRKISYSFSNNEINKVKLET